MGYNSASETGTSTRVESRRRHSLLFCLSTPLLSVLVSLAVRVANGQSSNDTSLAWFEHLDAEHQKSVLNASQQFQSERRPLPEHGLYTDFPAIVYATRSGEPSLADWLARVARDTRIPVVLTARDSGSGTSKTPPNSEGVLVVQAPAAGTNLIWPVELETLGKWEPTRQRTLDERLQTGPPRHLLAHILAQDRTESLIHDAVAQGHLYVAHDWLCDPTGFMFGAINNLGVFSMGDSAPMQGRTRLTAMAPVPATLRLIQGDKVLQETTGTNLTYEASEPGPYRLEAWLKVDGQERPWILSNPVRLRTLSAAEMRLPGSTASPEVESHKDITYLEGPEETAGKHKLNIYSPKGKSQAPVFFFIHGGAWKSGDRSLYGPLGNRYASAGLVTVVPSYRLAPKYPHPAQIEDVAAAFAWTVRHVEEYGGDTNRIYVGGHSAGGHLAALLSLDPQYLAAYQLSPKLIRGVLALSGVYNFTRGESQDSVFGRDPAQRRAASPLFHVQPGASPFLVTYCEWDYFSLPAQAREFARALRQAGVKTDLVYIPGQSHISEMINVTKADDPLVTAALNFMK